LDNLTGLMWARDASNACGLAVANTDWNTAIDSCNSLVYGGYDDWRLPNARELYSLVDGRFANPCLCNTEGTGQWTEGNPFHDVQTAIDYWTSTSHKRTTSEKWTMRLWDGMLRPAGAATCPAWPVRGGGD
jgi:hypothetical protein